MAFLNRLATRNNPLESPAIPLSSLGNPGGWFLNWANGEPTSSGEHVTPFTALQVTTITACVKLISEGIGQMPIHVVESLDRGQRIANSHPYFDLLASEWNPEMTATVAMQVSLVHALLWGTSYIEIIRDNGNRVAELWPRKPWLTEPKRDKTGALVYECKDTADGHARIIAAADMLCIPGLSLDGFVGQHTTQIARNTIGLSLALEKHSGTFFSNGAVSAATVEVPNELSDKAYQRLKTSMDRQTTGDNKHRTVLLEGGAKWNQIASQNDQAQFLESKRQVRSELCSLMRVPLYMIASDESKGVKSNTEQIANDFLVFTLTPWMVRYIQEINRKVFPRLGRTSGKYLVRFEVKSLMSADSAGRMAYYTQARNAGLLTINECRLLEGLEPVGPEGDVLMVPLNMIPATELLKEESDTAPPPVVEPPAPPADSKPVETEPASEDNRSTPLLPRLIRNYSPLFADGFSRLSNRSKRDSAAIRQCLAPAMEAVSASLLDMLSYQDKTQAGDGESKRAIDKYLDGLATRYNPAADQTAEVTRALKSLTHAAYRDVASAKANAALKEIADETIETEVE
jgi:HK97 family phage portal protein